MRYVKKFILLIFFLHNCVFCCIIIISNEKKGRIFMDIKAKIEEIVNKLQNDKTLLSSFEKEPVKTIEKLLGVDLPDDTIQKIVDGVKAKIKVDDVKGILNGVKGLFGK